VENGPQSSLDEFARRSSAYPTADQVGRCLVFDAPGARRLIVGVYYSKPEKEDSGTLYIKHSLTHAEYDRGDWKKDC
jgi:mRNA interferase HigB